MTKQQKAALLVLFNLAREDEPADLSLIAARLGLSCVETDDLLSQLDRAGLVDAERVRLTLPGLAIAVSADARRTQRTRDGGRRRSASRAA